MTQGNRIREIRKTLDLTLEKFGEKIGMKKNSISQIENGKNNPTEQTIKAICREYNVNEEWLRTGTGDMFKTLLPLDETASVVSELLEEENPLYDIIIGIMKTYNQLNPKSQEVIKDFSTQLLHNLQKKED